MVSRRIAWFGLAIITASQLLGCCTTQGPEVRMGTYIITDNADDVTWTKNLGALFPSINSIVAQQPNPSYLVLRFTGIPDTLLQSATLRLMPNFTSSVLFNVYLVVRNVAPPTSHAVLSQYVLSETPVASFTDAGVTDGVAVEIPLTLTEDLVMMWRGSRQGDLILVLEATSGLAFFDTAAADDPPRLSTVEASLNTGLTGARYITDWERMRGTGGMVCPKTGQIMARTEAVRDGYTGMLVHPDAYDPPEPKEPPRRVREEDWSWEG